MSTLHFGDGPWSGSSHRRCPRLSNLPLPLRSPAESIAASERPFASRLTRKMGQTQTVFLPPWIPSTEAEKVNEAEFREAIMKLSSAAANLIAPHPLHEDPEFCFDWVEHRPFAEAAYRGDKRLHRLLPKLVPRRFVTLHSHHRLNASSSDDCCCSIHTIAVLFYRVCVCLADRPEALVCASFLCLLLTCSRVRPRLSASPQHIRGGLLAQLLLACLCRQAPLRAVR